MELNSNIILQQSPSSFGQRFEAGRRARLEEDEYARNAMRQQQQDARLGRQDARLQRDDDDEQALKGIFNGALEAGADGHPRLNEQKLLTDLYRLSPEKALQLQEKFSARDIAIKERAYTEKNRNLPDLAQLNDGTLYDKRNPVGIELGKQYNKPKEYGTGVNYDENGRGFVMDNLGTPKFIGTNKAKEVTTLTNTGKLNKALQTGEITQAQYNRELEKDLGGKPMSELQKQKLTTNMAKDFKTAGQSVQTMQEILNSIVTLRDSKGLAAREGYTGYLPAWAQGKEAMTVENRLNTLKGKVTQMGKAMATLSGAIGPMAVQEWKIVSDAVNAIDPRAGNFDEQLNNIEAQATGASARIKESYDNTYAGNFEQYPNMTSENIKIYPSTIDNPQGTILPKDAKMPLKPMNASEKTRYDAWKKANGR